MRQFLLDLRLIMSNLRLFSILTHTFARVPYLIVEEHLIHSQCLIIPLQKNINQITYREAGLFKAVGLRITEYGTESFTIKSIVRR